MDNGKDCCTVTDQDINDCLERNPYSAGRGLPGSNCQSNTRDRMSTCCLKSDWPPAWYAFHASEEDHCEIPY